jgi:hypothetical protein
MIRERPRSRHSAQAAVALFPPVRSRAFTHRVARNGPTAIPLDSSLHDATESPHARGWFGPERPGTAFDGVAPTEPRRVRCELGTILSLAQDLPLGPACDEGPASAFGWPAAERSEAPDGSGSPSAHHAARTSAPRARGSRSRPAPPMRTQTFRGLAALGHRPPGERADPSSRTIPRLCADRVVGPNGPHSGPYPELRQRTLLRANQGRAAGRGRFMHSRSRRVFTGQDQVISARDHCPAGPLQALKPGPDPGLVAGQDQQLQPTAVFVWVTQDGSRRLRGAARQRPERAIPPKTAPSCAFLP